MNKKKIIIYSSLTFILAGLFIALGVIYFKSSYLRIGESFVHIWESLKYYFCKIFSIEVEEEIGVIKYSENIAWNELFPQNYDEFKIKSKLYIQLFFDKNNFKHWMHNTGNTFSGFAKGVAIALPAIIILSIVIKKLYMKENNFHNEDTLPLRVFKAISKYTIEPLKKFIIGYIEYLKEINGPYILLILIWLINLNLLTILIEFVAYYFYFVVSFEGSTIYIQIVKLLLDLQVVVKRLPVVGIILTVTILYKVRKKIALSILNYYESRNCGFIKDLPIVSMTCGSMGKRKTTIITDMALSQEVMFRNEAFTRLQKIDMKFPNFPWIALEMAIQNAMLYREIYNLSTVKAYIRKKRDRYDKNGNVDVHLFGYDISKYPVNYYDSLKVINIWDAIETYAQLYFIYIIQSSLIVSNYSIREDNALISAGNFPIWHSNFFPDGLAKHDRFAHILDFDVLRLGRKLIEDNPNNGSFEFGVVNISEVGKERGNNLELKDIKKGCDDTNQKNDLFNTWLKMCRHSATVDNYPFIKVFTDEQRPESWGADARDLCDIITIIGVSSQKMTLPFYIYEEMICEGMYNWFMKLYYDIRFVRGDNTLLVYLLKGITSLLYKWNLKLNNQYGYSVAFVDKERGTMDAKPEKKRYYLMNKKIYSRRFSTDCFSDYFNDLAKQSVVGLDDYPAYESERATIEELDKQNSYFINSLYKKK